MPEKKRKNPREGAPHKTPKTTVGVLIDMETLSKLDEQAKRYGGNRNRIFREALHQYLEKNQTL